MRNLDSSHRLMCAFFLVSDISPALTTLWEAAKLGCFAVHDVVCARLLPTLGASAGIMRSGLLIREFISYRSRCGVQGNGHSTFWVGNLEMEMMMMQVETMSAFACHITSPRLTPMLVVGHFLTTRSGGDGDEPIILSMHDRNFSDWIVARR
jgi:hypothetical protein